MFRSDPHSVPHPLKDRPPLADLLIAAAVLCATLAVAALVVFGTALPATLIFGCIVGLTTCGMMQGYPHTTLGVGNLVTLVRAAMVAFIGGAVLHPETSAWVIASVAFAALTLDGVDGWLARRTGLVSAFGARFDMETDAGLAAVMSLWLLVTGTMGPEILILGFMRYAFVMASFIWPVLQHDLPDVFRRKVICVVQIAALVVLVFPLTPHAMLLPIGAVAALLLTWSFLVDILWLIRRAA